MLSNSKEVAAATAVAAAAAGVVPVGEVKAETTIVNFRPLPKKQVLGKINPVH